MESAAGEFADKVRYYTARCSACRGGPTPAIRRPGRRPAPFGFTFGSGEYRLNVADKVRSYTVR